MRLFNTLRLAYFEDLESEDLSKAIDEDIKTKAKAEKKAELLGQWSKNPIADGVWTVGPGKVSVTTVGWSMINCDFIEINPKSSLTFGVEARAFADLYYNEKYNFMFYVYKSGASANKNLTTDQIERILMILSTILASGGGKFYQDELKTFLKTHEDI